MSAAGLELDFEEHIYRFGGKRQPGVSEVLTGLGIVEENYFTEFSRDRGTAVHTAVEFHLTGGLDWGSLDPRIRGYVEAACAFLKDAGIEAGPGTIVERPLFHPVYRYCGTPDLVCHAFGHRTVVDWKTGGLGCAGMATAAYEMLARVHYPMPKPTDVRRRIAVQLYPDGRYKKFDLQDGFDYSDWTSAVTLYNKFHMTRERRKDHGDRDTRHIED